MLSPYAAALKHVALKGKVALGPSAKEQELALYLKGQLPADYKAPLNGKWEDTVERWTYAWQFPIPEKAETTSQVLAKLPAFKKVMDFSQKLIEHPPQLLPPTSDSPWQRLETKTADESIASSSTQATFSIPAPSSSSNTTVDAASLATLDEENPTEVLRVSSMIETTPTVSNTIQVAEEGALADEDADQLAKRVGVPIAYIDDGTELSLASKEIGCIMMEDLGLMYDPRSCVSVIAAATRFTLDGAVALFRFFKSVQLVEGNVMAYNALMSGFAVKADVNTCIALVEEMKGEGITPSRETWHVLMRCFHRAKDHGAVIQVVDNMKAYANIEPDETTFLLHLNALAATGAGVSAPYEAIQLFDQMENVYGFLPTRQLYHALMACLRRNPTPEFVARIEEVGKKMEILGMLWDESTYEVLISASANVGDLKRVRELFAKMRNEKVPMTQRALTYAIGAYCTALDPKIFPYEQYKQEGKSPLPVWLEYLSTSFGIFDLVRQRGWTVSSELIDALLRIVRTVAGHCLMQTPDDSTTLARLETQIDTLWNKTYDELHVQKTTQSCHEYIAHLGTQLRIDEAENLFQEMVLSKDWTPTAFTYEEMMWMHMRSGEEGGTGRALAYMEAMEKAKIPIRPATVRKFVEVNNESGYVRDMRRRARRIMQAREEYMARKAEGVEFKQAEYKPPTTTEEGLPALNPLPISASSTLAWWDRWKRETVNKHELFDSEREDGQPKGESFAEKNEALLKMGIESKFLTKESVPDPARSKLLDALRKEGHEPAGSLWALDGGDLVYPEPGSGPEGWGVSLWRERQVIEKLVEKSKDGLLPLPPLSSAGNSVRLATEQLEIEKSGAKTVGDLADAELFPHHRYDDGTLKPASELVVPPRHTAELVWKRETADHLSSFKTDEELAALDSENLFLEKVRKDAEEKLGLAVKAIKEGREDDEEIIGRGLTRRGKHDYLAEWREQYRSGTLEVPDSPVLRFGRDADVDVGHSLASSVKAWYKKAKKTPPSAAALEEARAESELKEEGRRSRQAKAEARRKRRIRQPRTAGHEDPLVRDALSSEEDEV